MWVYVMVFFYVGVGVTVFVAVRALFWLWMERRRRVGIWIMTIDLIDLTCDVLSLLRFICVFLLLLGWIVYWSFFVWNSSDPKGKFTFYAFIVKVILYLYAGFVSSGTTNVTTEWQTWHEPTKLYLFILWPYFKVTAVSRFKLQKKCSFIYLEALREFWLHRLYHEYKSINWIQITDMFSDLTKTSTLAFSQFKMVLMGSKKPIIMRSNPSLRSLPQRRLWNSSNVRLIDDGPLSSFQGRSSNASPVHASLL